jgi:hypothetical protein
VGWLGSKPNGADGLIEAAEATGNPSWLGWALAAYGVAFRDADPVGALNALGRGLVIAHDSGNRAQASILAPFLARLEAEHSATVSAFDHLTLAIRNFHNAGDTTTIRVPLAVLAALFDRLGRYEPAATIAGFALSPFSAAAVPDIITAITHLHQVLGEATYETLARQGRDDDHRRHGDLRIRPNRPGPNRTQRLIAVRIESVQGGHHLVVVSTDFGIAQELDLLYLNLVGVRLHL